jgi:hypothetical protein
MSYGYAITGVELSFCEGQLNINHRFERSSALPQISPQFQHAMRVRCRIDWSCSIVSPGQVTSSHTGDGALYIHSYLSAVRGVGFTPIFARRQQTLARMPEQQIVDAVSNYAVRNIGQSVGAEAPE